MHLHLKCQVKKKSQGADEKARTWRLREKGARGSTRAKKEKQTSKGKI